MDMTDYLPKQGQTPEVPQSSREYHVADDDYREQHAQYIRRYAKWTRCPVSGMWNENPAAEDNPRLEEIREHRDRLRGLRV